MPDHWSGFCVPSSSDPMQQQSRCSCGFSAVRHRYLCGAGAGNNSGLWGLFPEDLNEACGDRAQRRQQLNFASKAVVARQVWFNPNNMVRSAYYLGDFSDSVFDNKNQRGAVTTALPMTYSVSRVDSVELNQIMSSIVGIAVSSSGLQKELNRPSKSHQPVFHPWESSGANPNIVVATEREPVTTNPQLVNAWEKLALAPYDQTKDVLYLAVVPDNNVVAEKCRVFLEELSNMYEKCRFGSHVKMQTKDSPRDAIIKVGHQRLNGMNPGPSTNGHNGSLQAFLNAFEEGKYLEDKKGLTSKLRGFIENYERELTQFFRANEHTLFERRAYHESIQRNNQHQHYTSLATSSDSSSMPPPAVPIQSPSSILSSASGPASGNCTAHLSVGPMAGVVQVQLSPSGQPLPGQPQQQSPNPLSNIAPGMEELTPESQQNGGTPNPHLQQQQQQQLDQANAIIEANIEKTVEEMLSLESPSYLPHVIVIYLINPFSFGSEAHHAIFARLANVALMRVFNCFLQQLDIRRRPQIQMEMLSLQSLYDYTAFAADPLREDRQSMESVENFTCRDKMSAQDCLRRTAFSVYSQSRLLMAENTRGVLPKSMTRFGPTSAMSDILDSLKSRPSTRLYKSVSPAPPTTPKLQIVNTEDRVLFVTYCFIADEWLCGAVTDEQGHLLDNVLINLFVPPAQNPNGNNMKWRHKKPITDIRLHTTSLALHPKCARHGHQELETGYWKAWTEILSKRNLRSYNSSLKNSVNSPNGCKTCSVAPVSQVISACLVSTEPELHLRIFPGSSENGNGNGSFSGSSFQSSGQASSGGGGSSKSAKSKSPPQWQCLPVWMTRL
uniref:Mediator of RNA polymerase II transcription subunit 13 n=1 Tax=Ditylenchus dipsaci TaxID=166011 RepID=A0A915EP20_9BILA